MIKYFIAVLLSAWSLQGHAGGQDVGSGGDVVMCTASPINDLSGYYSLDYLLTLDSNNSVVKVTSWQQSLWSIRQVLSSKLPELLNSFDEFQQNVLNTDYSKPQVWEPTGLALTPIHDQDLQSAVRIPENCRQGDQINIIQTVVRQFKDFSGAGKIVYKYVPEVFNSLNADRPLQLSFLLVHEWLWSISDNVDRNRRIAHFFHNQDFYTLDRQGLLTQLQGMGLQTLEQPLVVAADGSGGYMTIDDALAHVRPNGVIQVREGNYTTRGAVVDKSVQIIGVGDVEKTVIRGTSFAPALTLAGTTTDTIQIKNLSFLRPFSPDDREWRETVTISSGNPQIQGCHFGVTEFISTGILVASGANPVVSNNEFGNYKRAIFIDSGGGGHYKSNAYTNSDGAFDIQYVIPNQNLFFEEDPSVVIGAR